MGCVISARGHPQSMFGPVQVHKRIEGADYFLLAPLLLSFIRNGQGSSISCANTRVRPFWVYIQLKTTSIDFLSRSAEGHQPLDDFPSCHLPFIRQEQAIDSSLTHPPFSRASLLFGWSTVSGQKLKSINPPLRPSSGVRWYPSSYFILTLFTNTFPDDSCVTEDENFEPWKKNVSWLVTWHLIVQWEHRKRYAWALLHSQFKPGALVMHKEMHFTVLGQDLCFRHRCTPSRIIC